MSEDVKRLGGRTEPDTPRDVAAARQAVVSSRARISATIDELEDKIVDTKEALRDRLDVVRPVRAFVGAAPLIAMVAATGAGLLLGIVSRGRRKPEGEELELSRQDQAALDRWRRERRKRLLGAAEDELPSFGSPPSRVGRMFRDLAHDFAGAATAMLVAQLVNRVKDEEE